jgi:hypothetical protein
LIDFSADRANIAVDLTRGPRPVGPNGNMPASGTVTAIGIVDIHSCVPNCADGTATPEPMTIVLSDPITGEPTIWSQMTEAIKGRI